MNYRTLWAFSLLVFSTARCLASGGWHPAYPYTQRIAGQGISIKAISYAPYSASPMRGQTQVYDRKKLLYTIDRYYREKVFTSSDGHYFVVVHTSNAEGLKCSTTLGFEKVDVNQPAIELFRDGKVYKTFALKDVIDTSQLISQGVFFNWAYYLNPETFIDAELDCQLCMEIYGKKTLEIGDTSEIYKDEWERCKNACDSVKIKEPGLKLAQNSIYLQDNSLHVLTNQGTVIIVDFATLSIQRIPIASFFSSIKNYKPQKVFRKYKKIKLPAETEQPKLKDGRSFEAGLADLLGFSQASDKSPLSVFISYLVLDNLGNCIDFDGFVYDHSIPGAPSEESIDKTRTPKLNTWVREQKFQVKLIPKGFGEYSFLCDANLY